ncbi:MAG: DMT family transporter [Burkholderiales bacterium]
MRFALAHLRSQWMLVAGLLFAVMGLFVKLGSQRGFSGAELVFYRSLVGLFVVYGMVRHRGLSLRTQHLRSHLYRGLSGFVSLMLYFYAITWLPLATAVTLNYTSPLFLAVLTACVLKERVSPWVLAAVVAGFIGVALLLRPTFDSDAMLAGIVGVASGAFASIAYLNVKQLGQLGEPGPRIVFYFALISTLGAAAWMIAHDFHAITWESAGIILGLGTSATLAQLAMTRAYQEGQTLVVGSLAYSTVVFASLLGVLVWGEILGAASWIAIAIIVASGVVAMLAAPQQEFD